jgi:hypothetical protein
MQIGEILKKHLTVSTRGRILKLAQYFYLNNRISYGTFLYIQCKPLY